MSKEFKLGEKLEESVVQGMYYLAGPLHKMRESTALVDILKTVEEKGYRTGLLQQTAYHGGNGHLLVHRGEARVGVVVSRKEGQDIQYALYLQEDSSGNREV